MDNNGKLKIAFVVHGRFQAFELVKSLIEKGHNVTLFTNYPKWAVRRFGISGDNVKSFWLHGIISRFAWFLGGKIKFLYPEAWLHKMFGSWAAKEVKKERWDAVHSWSGVSEEILQALKNTKTLKLLMRCSAHICTQANLLEEEGRRINMPIDHPSEWMINREKREYAMADYIRVLSGFAYKSFIAEGIDPEKVLLISAAAPVESFRPTGQVMENRYKRILRNEPLRVLYVGTFSFQKGMYDMAAIMDELKEEKFRFRLIGPISSDARKFFAKTRHLAEFVPKQPQHELPKWYEWADIFIFPTIQDGHAQVLAQAQASGLPIISTTNCQAPDVIIENKTGWALPIRKPEVFIDRLRWCDLHREELAAIARNAYENFKPKKWSIVAEDFSKNITNLKGEK